MRWSELITIYLAIGAPIGVSHALSRGGAVRLWRRQTLLVVLLWPLAAIDWARRQPRFWQSSFLKMTKDEADDPIEQKELQVLRRLTALSRVLQPYQVVIDLEGTWQQTRVALETYSGLTRAVYESDNNVLAEPRELELLRIAARNGTDLICAGRCINRRNAIRLKVHQKQARQDFLATLQIWEQATAEVMQNLSRNKSAAANVGKHWYEFAECVRRLCILLQDADAAPEATRWEVGETSVTESLPVAPSLRKPYRLKWR